MLSISERAAVFFQERDLLSEFRSARGEPQLVVQLLLQGVRRRGLDVRRQREGACDVCAQFIAPAAQRVEYGGARVARAGGRRVAVEQETESAEFFKISIAVRICNLQPEIAFALRLARIEVWMKTLGELAIECLQLVRISVEIVQKLVLLPGCVASLRALPAIG